MEKIIKIYLESTYDITLKSYTSYKLYDKNSQQYIHLLGAYNEVSYIFDISHDEFNVIWDEWLKSKSLEFENKLVNIQYLIYEKTGLKLDLENPNWSDTIDDVAEKLIINLINL